MPISTFLGANGEDWSERARCRGVDPSIFFPDQKGRDGANEAKALCRECSVRRQCLEYALLHGDRGIWGGMTEKERRAIRRSRRSGMVLS